MNRDTLEEIILRTRELCDEGRMPAGHKERFLERLQQREAKKNLWQRLIDWSSNLYTGRGLSLAITGGLCAVAVAFLLLKDPSVTDSTKRMENKYMFEMEKYAEELADQISQMGEFDREDVKYSIESIVTSDTIPMNLQLPKEMSKKEKQKIIKEYYERKMEGLKKVKTFIAINTEQEN